MPVSVMPPEQCGGLVLRSAEHVERIAHVAMCSALTVGVEPKEGYPYAVVSFLTADRSLVPQGSSSAHRVTVPEGKLELTYTWCPASEIIQGLSESSVPRHALRALGNIASASPVAIMSARAHNLELGTTENLRLAVTVPVKPVSEDYQRIREFLEPRCVQTRPPTTFRINTDQTVAPGQRLFFGVDYKLLILP